MTEFVADGCALCAFTRPDEAEQSLRITCRSCQISVHKRCYYGRDSDFLSEEERSAEVEQEREGKEEPKKKKKDKKEEKQDEQEGNLSSVSSLSSSPSSSLD